MVVGARHAGLSISETAGVLGFLDTKVYTKDCNKQTTVSLITVDERSQRIVWFKLTGCLW